MGHPTRPHCPSSGVQSSPILTHLLLRVRPPHTPLVPCRPRGAAPPCCPTPRRWLPSSFLLFSHGDLIPGRVLVTPIPLQAELLPGLLTARPVPPGAASVMGLGASPPGIPALPPSPPSQPMAPPPTPKLQSSLTHSFPPHKSNHYHNHNVIRVTSQLFCPKASRTFTSLQCPQI